MDTVAGTGLAPQVRLSERQLGWRLPCPRRGRGPSVSGTRFMSPPRVTSSNNLSTVCGPRACRLAHRQPVSSTSPTGRETMRPADRASH